MTDSATDPLSPHAHKDLPGSSSPAAPAVFPPPEAPPKAPIDDSLPALFGRLGPAAWLATVWTFAPAVLGTTLLVFIGSVSRWLRDHGDTGPFVYAAGFILAAGVGVLPTISQAVLGGWAFGFWIGLPAAMTGFTGGSIIGYFIARAVARRRVDAEFDLHPRWAAVRDALLKSGRLKTLLIVTLVRVPPNSPFSLTNFVLATARTPLWAYALGTAVGMLPRTTVVVWLASQIQGELNSDTLAAARPWWFFPATLGLGVAIFFVLSHFGKKAIERATRQTPPQTA